MGFIYSLIALILIGAGAWLCRLLALRWARRMTIPLLLREKALVVGPYGLILADATLPDNPVIFVNRAFEKITGYNSSDIIGKNCRLLQGTDRDQKGVLEIRKALREQRECRVLLRNYRKDGSPFWSDLYLAPIRNDMGRVVQFVGVQQDVTEREQTARRLATDAAIIRALAESPSIFEAAPRILQAIGEAQDWDVGTFWKPQDHTGTLQCVDLWQAAELDLGEFIRFIHETTFTQDMGVPGHVWSRGEPTWIADIVKENRFPEASLAAKAGLVSACGFPIANRKGLQGVLVFYSRRIWPLSKSLLLLMVGTGTQISQYMEREEVEVEKKALTFFERGFPEFFGEGLLAMDRDGICLYANSVAGKMLGIVPSALVGQKVHDFLHTDSAGTACHPEECAILSSLKTKHTVYVDAVGTVFRRQSGPPLPVSYTASPIMDQDIIRGAMITFVDATERQIREANLLRDLAGKDAEIARIQDVLSQTQRSKDGSSSSDALIDQIRKLLA